MADFQQYQTVATTYSVGVAYLELAADQAEWSQATFGTDAERGPIGALKHLEKEAREAAAAPHDVTEYADCLLLIMDASRRAGFSPVQLFNAAHAKMVVNRARVWPKTTGDVPTEHAREERTTPEPYSYSDSEDDPDRLGY